MASPGSALNMVLDTLSYSFVTRVREIGKKKFHQVMDLYYPSVFEKGLNEKKGLPLLLVEERQTLYLVLYARSTEHWCSPGCSYLSSLCTCLRLSQSVRWAIGKGWRAGGAARPESKRISPSQKFILPLSL